MRKWFKRKNTNSISSQPLENDQDDSEWKVREPMQVAERVLALLAVIGKVHQGNDSKFMGWINQYSIKNYLSPLEYNFFQLDSPEQKTLVNFSWRAEALTSLLWGTRFIPEMPALNEGFNVYSLDSLADIINDPNEFKKNIKLRPDQELQEMEQSLFQEHWRVRDAQLFGKEMPSELDPSVVYERRYGLSWLVGHGDDWDNVPTDT
ncbi:MAG TPA: DUF4272 domain-containing protein [Cytophagales bacterium]|nr:DUF4272 domain-containing protein [Cytophagales bacterium]HAA22648.1 DUF4272 domain-containing protein [Cytophagales bacterium]HAP62234.1 DUF4272 domain-containing protein [Cytophagales bacterium]